MLEKTKRVAKSSTAPVKLLEDLDPEGGREVGPGERVTIPAPRMQTVIITLKGVTPYVSNNFSQEAQDQMAATQKLGQQARKGKTRAPKDFDKEAECRMQSPAVQAEPCVAQSGRAE